MTAVIFHFFNNSLGPFQCYFYKIMIFFGLNTGFFFLIAKVSHIKFLTDYPDTFDFVLEKYKCKATVITLEENFGKFSSKLRRNFQRYLQKILKKLGKYILQMFFFNFQPNFVKP